MNAAAYTAVDKAEDEPELACLINAVAPGSMASVAAAGELPFIQISTDYKFPMELRKNRMMKRIAPVLLMFYGKVKLLG